MANTTTQAKYDSMVSKYGQSAIDEAMSKGNITIEDSSNNESIKMIEGTNEDYNKTTPDIKGESKTGDTVYEETYRKDGNYSSEELSNNAKAEAKRAAEKAAKLKKEYEEASKKAGGYDNMLKLAEKNHGVNSSEYKAIKAKIAKYETPESTVIESKKEETIDPISTSNGLTETQYNALLKKYGTADGVVEATKNQWGENSTAATKMQTMLDNYAGTTSSSNKIRENETITDANLRGKDETIGSLEETNKTESDGLTNYLNSLGKKSSFSDKEDLAKEMGIKNYTGSITQNAELLKKVKASNEKIVPENDTSIISGILVPKEELDAYEGKDKITATAANLETLAKLRLTGKSDEELLSLVEEKSGKDSDEYKKFKTFILSNTSKTEAEIAADNLEELKAQRLEGKDDETLLAPVEEKYGVDSAEYRKFKSFIEENPLTDSTEGVNSELFDKSKEESDKIKLDSQEALRDEQIAAKSKDLLESIKVITDKNEDMQQFYTDMETDLATAISENNEREREALQRTKNAQLNKVVGQIRATLARRGVDIGSIPPEQLIAMSGELGANAMAIIDEATSDMEDSVAEFTEAKTAIINQYKEQGILDESEAAASIEKLRELKETMITDIKSTFIANAFNITDTSTADEEQNKADVMNAVSTFATQSGISYTAQGVMASYLDDGTSVEALTNMINDLNDKNSKLYKAVNDAEKAANLAAQFEQEIALMEATPTSYSSSSGSSSNSTKAIGETMMKALLKEGVPNATNYKTYGELEAAMNASDNKDFKEKIMNALSTTSNPLSVVDFDEDTTNTTTTNNLSSIISGLLNK